MSGPENKLKIWYLSQVDLFHGFSETELNEIDRMTPMNLVSRGSIFLSPGSADRSLFIIKRGHIRLFKVNEEGKEFTLAFLGGGDIFGEVEALSDKREGSFAQAVEDTEICSLGNEELLRLLRDRPQFALNLLQVLTGRLRETEELLTSQALKDVRSRLLQVLLKLGQRNLDRNSGRNRQEFIALGLRLSHQDLATMVGCTRETISVTLSALARQGLVRTGRREIEVHMDRVAQVLGEGEQAGRQPGPPAL